MTPQHDRARNRPPGLLLVEPVSAARISLSREMEEQGWRVWSAPDAPSAVELYRENSGLIDVALVDLLLPGLEGGRILAELGRLNPDLARCAMSADLNGYTASAFRRVSGTPLFPKPLQARALASALHGIVADSCQG